MASFKLTAANLLILLATMLALVNSDFNTDKKECQDQLITLSSCLNYVVGAAKEPTPQCCTVLHSRINVTKRCLCMLVKDRNEPSLGLKLNATRFLILANICHTVSNAMECLDLLGLDPSSPDAQIFIQAANITQGVADDNGPISPSKSGGKQTWRNMGIYSTLLWCLLGVNLLMNFTFRYPNL